MIATAVIEGYARGKWIDEGLAQEISTQLMDFGDTLMRRQMAAKYAPHLTHNSDKLEAPPALEQLRAAMNSPAKTGRGPKS